jgi:hypothetical protein
MTARIGLTAVRSRNVVIERQPAREPIVRGVPGERGVIRVARRDDSAWPHDPAHLLQRGHRIRKMLQYLMGVHDVPRPIVERHRVNITRHELDARMITPCGGDDVGRGIDSADSPGRETHSEVGGDRSGAAAHVDKIQSRPQMGNEIGGGVLHRSPPMRAQDTFVMSVCIRGMAHVGRPLDGDRYTITRP